MRFLRAELLKFVQRHSFSPSIAGSRCTSLSARPLSNFLSSLLLLSVEGGRWTEMVTAMLARLIQTADLLKMIYLPVAGFV